MLLAYIDEIGEPGAFVSREHARFNTSPAFGYAGFIVPSDNARTFGAIFNREKQAMFRTEVAAASHPGRWERKGADLFRPETHTRYPQQVRMFNHLVKKVRELHGALFYYADEKPLGTPGQVRVDPAERETAAMQESLNRIARYANRCDQHVMVMIDQINEKTRAERLPKMYSHILGRASDYPEMRRIIEPPMHVDSSLSSNIQFADWVAACVTRAIDYQLNPNSLYEWVTGTSLKASQQSFTHESKLHLWQRSVPDLNHSKVFSSTRTVYPPSAGNNVASALTPAKVRSIRAAAEKAHLKPRH